MYSPFMQRGYFTSSLTEKSPVEMIKEQELMKNQRAFTPLGVFTTAASEVEMNPQSYNLSFNTMSGDPYA